MPDVARLGLAALPALPAAVARPAYDPADVTVGILHLGLGAFHRAHQAVYTDDVLGGDPRWGICGVSLKTPRAIEPLAAQDGLYTLLTRTSDGISARVIGALRETMFAGAERAALVARFADPRITVVTSTVTEKGYCHDPATGALNEAHPDIVHDLAHPDAPESAIGILVAGIAARRAANAGPLTFVCCDNLPHNGRMVEALVHAFARRRDAVARGLDSRQRRVSVDDGRPHRAGHDRCGRCRGRAPDRRARRGAGDGGGVRTMDHRGPHCRGAPALGRRGRAIRRRRRAVRAHEAAPAERQPFHTRVPRFPDGARVRLASVARSAARHAHRAADGRGNRAHARAAARHRPCRLLRPAARALSQRGTAAPDAADRDGRLAENAAAPAGDDSRAAGGRVRRWRI